VTVRATEVQVATGFAGLVAEVVRSVPAGTVVTYGEVAAEAGRPGAARAVGGVLAASGEGRPWWRVVTSVPALNGQPGRH